MGTQVPEWARSPLLQQLWKGPFSPLPTAPSSQLHILELKHHTVGIESGLEWHYSDQIPAEQ